MATAGSHKLTVDQVVQLLASQPKIPLQKDVVQALAGLWVDYTLLATDAAQDSTLRFLNLEPLVRMQLDEEMIAQFSDSAIPLDTAISDTELHALYERQAPGARLRASHILLKYPAQATQAQRDSVRAELESIRKRALAGESFAALARRYSQDPQTAAKGGDLGEFGRGDLPPALDSAAFSLRPGQISQVVESPYGLHILKIEARIVPPFDSVRAGFRAQIQQQRAFKAESTFVAGLDSAAAPQVAKDASAMVRRIASDPVEQLSARARQQALATYKGGVYTVGQLQSFVQTRSDQWRAGVNGATDAQIEAFLHSMVERELMVAKARAAGMAPSQAKVDSLVEATRGRLVELTDELGLLHIERTSGEALAPAVDHAVDAVMQGIVAGTKQVVPLGPIGFQLRERSRNTAVYDQGVSDALARLGQVRGPGGAQTPAGGDTAGSTPDSPGR